ncbi:MFS transporter [Halalkalibacterium ligniniphilum]|uniref:MFS transporter n=1 Tax=Halalkalibacterium ligniniphilum TaxID=1134413 RepID=UPI0003485C04|nr:MFS transporter [Halalkalibacterium ligniniphilum]
MTLSKSNWWLFVSVSCGLYWFAHSITRPVIALYANSTGATEWEIGILLGIYAFFPFFLAIPIGGLVNAVGKVTLLRIGAWLMVVSAVLYVLSVNIWVLLIAQFVAGLGQLLVWLIVQVMVTGEKDQKLKNKRIASFSLYMALGQLLGPLLGGILSDMYGYVSTFAVYSIVCILLTIVSYFLKEQEQSTWRIPNFYQMFIESAELIKNIGFVAALMCSFIVLFIIDARMSFLPIHLEEIHFSHTVIGILLSVASLSALMIKPIYPYLVSRFGYYKLLGGSFMVSLSLLFLAPIPHSYLSIGILIFISGLALSINQPLSLSLISEQTREEQRGIAFGMRLMANRGAQLMDPLIFGFVASVSTLQNAFLIVGFLLTILSFGALKLFSLAETRKVRGEIENSITP